MSKQGRDEVMTYFFERYERASYRVVPGHWPNFKTKEEVDEYIDTTEKNHGNRRGALCRQR